MSSEVVLVVATTSDYIEKIRLRHPGWALFLTAHPVQEEVSQDMTE